jgi:hypothetical protein
VAGVQNDKAVRFSFWLFGFFTFWIFPLMSFSNLAVVKTHLMNNVAHSQRIENLSVSFRESDEVVLPDHNLITDSDTVKWIAQLAPTAAGQMQFPATWWVNTGETQLVPNTVVIAQTESLQTVYVEEVDYQVDHAQGQIRRTPDSSIADNAPVYVYYLTYKLFERGSDYEINCGTGILTRNSGGRMPEGASVWVDYSVTAGSVTEDLIAACLVEADDLILRLLSANYNGSSTDQGLMTGETQLALALCARSMAAEVLGRVTSSDASGRAAQYLKLADTWEQQAWITLQPFLDPLALRSPEKHSNA